MTGFLDRLLTWFYVVVILFLRIITWPFRRKQIKADKEFLERIKKAEENPLFCETVFCPKCGKMCTQYTSTAEGVKQIVCTCGWMTEQAKKEREKTK